MMQDKELEIGRSERGKRKGQKRQIKKRVEQRERVEALGKCDWAGAGANMRTGGAKHRPIIPCEAGTWRMNILLSSDPGSGMKFSPRHDRMPLHHTLYLHYRVVVEITLYLINSNVVYC
jgi:hypothetical protein